MDDGVRSPVGAAVCCVREARASTTDSLFSDCWIDCGSSGSGRVEGICGVDEAAALSRTIPEQSPKGPKKSWTAMMKRRVRTKRQHQLLTSGSSEDDEHPPLRELVSIQQHADNDTHPLDTNNNGAFEMVVDQNQSITDAESKREVEEEFEHEDDAFLPPPIYAAPTTETLGDEERSLLQSIPRPYPAQVPTRFRRRLDEQPSQQRLHSQARSDGLTGANSGRRSSSHVNAGRVSTVHYNQHTKHPPATASARSANINSGNSTPQRGTIHQQREQSSKSTTPVRSRSNACTAAALAVSPQRHRHLRPRNASTVEREFQHESDFCTVRVRSVPVAQRSAFESTPPVSTSRWHELCTAANTRRRSGNMHKRMSPSLQHLELLHAQQSMTVIRQLDFSPSTSLHSDLLDESCRENVDDTDLADVESTKLSSRRRKRDGRSRSIDPVTATVNALPSTPPELSNKKVRLPTRADVGFPNAALSDIQNKQLEIQHETAWEEASPRLIVLVTSDDVGTAVQEDASENGSNRDKLTPDHLAWNGGGLHGIPWAGKELLQAKDRNARHFGSNSDQAQPPASCLRPNEHSILAPPLDSSFSSSQGWRPRPFHDRPAGIAYFLACPLQIEFDLGNVEPLVCSLALYALSLGKNETRRQQEAFGKMSELFWFPAGHWTADQLDLDAIKAEYAGDRQSTSAVDPELLKRWTNRKQKAIFSYEPLALPGSGEQSLHVVLQVYKMAHENPVSPYLSAEGLANRGAARRVEERAKRMFRSHGAQHLTPLCFGVSPLFQGKKASSDWSRMRWPLGDTRNMQLYAYPPRPETQEAFVERLNNIVFGSTSMGTSVGDASGSSSPLTINGDDNSTHSDNAGDGQHVAVSSATLCDASSTSSKKKSVVSRLFRSPKKVVRSQSRSSASPGPRRLPGSDISVDLSSQVPVDGRAKLFLSSLSADFLQCMLTNPAELSDEREDTGESHDGDDRPKRFAKLFVDVSGDYAVWLDPNQVQLHHPVAADGAAPKKRSHLLRLPSPSEPAGYISSCEFREVLFLPARPEKHYDVDAPLSNRSLINLLFLYPRVLRLVGDSRSTDDLASFTIRIQVVQSESVVDEDSGQAESQSKPLSLFHSSSPWAGPDLLDAVYTSFTDVCYNSKHNALFSDGFWKRGVPIRDEFKLRLPQVLDGSYYLHFTLFSVDFSSDGDDHGPALFPVAETSIPLSSSSPRDSVSGTRVATVIPNGNYRLKLGEFQLQMESRLVSSLHVGDPAVATALRDFPYPKDTEKQQRTVGHNGEMIEPLLGVSQSSSKVVEFGQSFPSLLATASESSVLAHFGVLLHMHLCNLVNLSEKGQQDARTGARFMMGNMRSLFELFYKAKTNLHSSGVAENGKKRVKAFLKKTLDMLDEGYLSPVSSPWVEHHAEASDSVSVPDAVQSTASASHDDGPDDEHQEGMDDSVIRFRNRSSRQRKHDVRVTRIVAALGASGVPLSRVAYGASKTDRMRIEAELHNDGGHFAHYFDDDETIATAPTLATNSGRYDALPNGIRLGKQEVDDSVSRNGIMRSDGEMAEAEGDRYIGNTEFVKRVRTAAQVMLAPCVGPSLSNILAGRSSSPRKSNAKLRNDVQSADNSTEQKQTTKNGYCSCSAGSDIDDEPEALVELRVHGNVQCVFRGPQDGPLLLFTVQSRDGHEVPVASGGYLYESIMVLWLRAWLDHVENSPAEPLDMFSLTGRKVAAFAIPEYFSEPPEQIIYSFYAHMDFLLPLCLKSIVLRYSVEVTPMYYTAARAIVDESHLLVLEPFVEMLARGLIGQALSGVGSPSDRDKALLRALTSSELVLDFFVGLLPVLHPEHMNALLTKYFRTLRSCETEHLGREFVEGDFEWTEESLHRVRCSRQLRLRAVECFAVLPSFLAMNYPLKYSRHKGPATPENATWMQQYKEICEDWPSPIPGSAVYPDGVERLPASGWLATLVINEGLSVCSLSCEAVVAEAMAHIEVSQKESSRSTSPIASSLKKRPGAALKRGDLLMFQSVAIHAITAVYELVLRRHAMDRRFQKESCRERIAALFAGSILERSISSVPILARLSRTHKLRSTWLLCFVYVLQEAPDAMIRDHIRSFCDPKDVRIHRFIRLLRLSSSTFCSFVCLPRHALFPSEVDKALSPWLLQESFNTICAAANTVVEECVNLTSSYPREQQKLMQGVLDLLLHLLTTPQSSVTHLRAVGGALQALEQFGVELFLEITATNLQHWIRVILSLMNRVSLSVRSISVDFVVSLLGGTFELLGNIDAISIIFVSVLPEVAAREIALYSVSGLISKMDDVEKSVWPLRRSFADLEDANPLDDDRVDPQLSPILTVFCRACQAAIDGVLIEMRLRGDNLSIVGSRVATSQSNTCYEADEESLFEVATFFVAETAPMQRIRWLLTLRTLHESKQQWVEAAETLFLCAQTISDSIPHLKNVWRPSRFDLWSDSRRSLWLETVGEDLGLPDRGNPQVVDFADDFLEPADILGSPWKPSATGKLPLPNVPTMCTAMTNFAKEAITFYLREDGMDLEELAYSRSEQLLKAVVNVLDDHHHWSTFGAHLSFRTASGLAARRRQVEDESALRGVLASISGDMTGLAERMVLNVQDEPAAAAEGGVAPRVPRGSNTSALTSRPFYVVMRVYGRKPGCFQESTTLPPFLEWNTMCICRVPKNGTKMQEPKLLALQFAKPFVAALKAESGDDSVVLRTDPNDPSGPDDDTWTYLDVLPVEAAGTEYGGVAGATASLFSRRFIHQKYEPNDTTMVQPILVELAVAHAFPCALSRQRSLLTAEISAR